MRTWTSRYSNKELQNGNYYTVGISVGKPRWPLGYTVNEQCYAIAPTRNMLDMPYGEYRVAYFDKLNQLGLAKVCNLIDTWNSNAFSKGKTEVVLLCYEDIRKPDDWCHRTLFAEWLYNQVKLEITELTDPSVPRFKKPEPVEDPNYKQLSLF